MRSDIGLAECYLERGGVTGNIAAGREVILQTKLIEEAADKAASFFHVENYHILRLLYGPDATMTLKNGCGVAYTNEREDRGV